MITRSPKSGGVLLGAVLAPQPGEGVQLGEQLVPFVGAPPVLPAAPFPPIFVSPAEPLLETVPLPPMLG